MKRFILVISIGIGQIATALTAHGFGAGFKYKEFPLSNSAERSCLASQGDLPPDLNTLTINLKDMAVVWAPPSKTSHLKILFVEIKMIGDGLYGKYVQRVFAGQELNCIFGNKEIDATLLADQTKIKTPGEFILGDLRPSDPSLSRSFEVEAQYRVFGIIFSAGQENQTVEYTDNLTFKFQPIVE